MNECTIRPCLPGYVSIKEAAKLLDLSDKRVYEYVDQGRLSSLWAGNVIMIPLAEVKAFKRRSSGRPRKTIPPWRASSGENNLIITTIAVRIRHGQYDALLARLEAMRQSQQHQFPGTVARFVAEHAGQATICLVYKAGAMPSEEMQERALVALRQDLTDVLDWKTAHYATSRVLMHA